MMFCCLIGISYQYIAGSSGDYLPLSPGAARSIIIIKSRIKGKIKSKLFPMCFKRSR
ncbi:hypothetical protein bas60_0142 [Escherichia phage PaulScherrer]|nr:hypothetical protein bas60_0142 [Escherichia phage PaulScherrer]